MRAIKEDTSNFIKDAQVSAIEQPNDTELILGAINFVYHSSSLELIHIDENSKNYYRGKMSLEKNCKKFIEVFEMVKSKESSNV